jgi:hypothetical protein
LKKRSFRISNINSYLEEFYMKTLKIKLLRKMGGYLGGALFIATFVAGSALAQEHMIYPAKGQSQDQMEKDKFECYSWGKQQSGFDPMAPPTATEPPPQQQAKKGGAGRGAARGAAVGYAGGKIVSGSGSTGAKAGAATGALVGGMRRRDQQRQQQQAQQQYAQQQTAQYTQARDSYNRAYRACLEGRGYTVN